MTQPAEPIALRGAPGSPYTRKMLAVLRYKRIPYRFLVGAGPAGLPEPKVPIIPVFYFPNDDGSLEAAVDSTPLIRRIDPWRPDRAVVPPDPALRFLDELIEDYADEWLTKCMFHYRWVRPADIEQAAAILPIWRDVTAPWEALAQASAQFSRRQIDRLYVVGSNSTTAPVIEDSYERFLDAFEAHLSRHPFLMGARPGAADFGVHGQLTQLTHFDPTPTAVTLARAPRVYAWVDLMEDLSGLEPSEEGWGAPEALAESLHPLLDEMGRTYAPVMAANARALMDGAAEVTCEVDGRSWSQTPFPYQGRCVAALRASFSALPDADQGRVRALLPPALQALVGAEPPV